MDSSKINVLLKDYAKAKEKASDCGRYLRYWQDIRVTLQTRINKLIRENPDNELKLS